MPRVGEGVCEVLRVQELQHWVFVDLVHAEGGKDFDRSIRGYC